MAGKAKGLCRYDGAMRTGLLPAILSMLALTLTACGDAGAADDAGPPDAAQYRERIETGSGRKLAAGPSAEEKALDDALFAQLNGFDGFVGVAVHDIDRNRTVDFNGGELFPQQSISKLWVTLTALRMVDAGELDLTEPAMIGYRDLTLFHQPVRQFVAARGYYRTDYADLMARAITQSDNTANDMLLKRVGGPAAVRATIAKAGLGAIRFGPGEREMQSAIAGLEWRQSFSVGRSFYQARAQVPELQRRIAFDGYVADPVDGASPRAIAVALGRVARGEILQPATAGHLLMLLGKTKSGPRRLKGGLPQGWTIGHKTGTGQELGHEQAGYNDVGILTAPEGHRYAVAVMIGRTAVPIPQRMEMMHAVVRAVATYHYAALGQAAPEPPV